jgi:hypothetical protein
VKVTTFNFLYLFLVPLGGGRTPNPWINRTQIGFHLPEAAEATLTVYDETGRLLYTQTGDFAKGYNAFAVDRALVSGSGALFYKVATGMDSEIKTMIITK